MAFKMERETEREREREIFLCVCIGVCYPLSVCMYVSDDRVGRCQTVDVPSCSVPVPTMADSTEDVPLLTRKRCNTMPGTFTVAGDVTETDSHVDEGRRAATL